MEILIEDFNAKAGREGIFKPIIANEGLIKSPTSPHNDIYKHTWTSSDSVIHNQTDHVLIDKRRHSNILDVRSFRGADSDTDHYLVVAKLRERISVSKQARQKFVSEIFDLKKFDDIEVKEKYQVETSNRFTTLESLHECFDITNAWNSIRQNIQTSAEDNLGYQKLKHKKLWFDDGRSKL
jgi:hypothetical protein